MTDVVLDNGNTLVVDVTISEGTLRVQDLIPRMLSVLRIVAPAHYEQVTFAMHPLPPAHALEDDEADWWISEACLDFYDELYNLLNDHAPEGYVFSSHPGDGADFGYWGDVGYG